MISAIIAGGSGTRLWPLSTSDRPKHLLALTDDTSLLQQAYERAAAIGETVYVITEASHADEVKAQLPDLPDKNCIVEPARRGTAHCIIMALDVIRRRHGEEATVAFIHSDHQVRNRDGFKQSFAVAETVSQQTEAITLIGIEPNYPATGFGYIQIDGVIDEVNGAHKVQSFVEKPDYETASRYLESGNYLWNCGYFVGSTKTFLTAMRRHAPTLLATYESLAAIESPTSADYQAQYMALGNEVIDVSLLEKTEQLAVVPARFDWMDIGNFKDLHDTVPKDELGNYQHGQAIYGLDVEASYIRNDEAKPVAVIGLDNIVVVNTPDGLLVARKDVAMRTGEVAKKVQGS